MKLKYRSQKGLNTVGPYSGTIQCYAGRGYREDEETCYVEIADCNHKIHLHLYTNNGYVTKKKITAFVKKLTKLRNEIDKFIIYLNKYVEESE